MAGLTAAGALLLTGCTTVLVPPDSPEDPQPVFLLDHGHHATLILPRPEGRLVRYAYGDWAYYGRNRTGTTQGLAALLWSTPATLGRRELAGPATPERVRAAVVVVIQDLYRLEVPRTRLKALQSRLDRVFAESAAGPRFNQWYDLRFVRLTESYSLLHNSNSRVGEWLEELGVAVHGRPLWSSWWVQQH